MRLYRSELLIWRKLYVDECREQNKEPVEMGQWERELKAKGLEIIDRKSLLNAHLGVIR
nr:MAG TPA: hypothetical protein [Caudoviricetes sp.]